MAVSWRLLIVMVVLPLVSTACSSGDGGADRAADTSKFEHKGSSDGKPTRNADALHDGLSSRTHAGVPPTNATLSPPLLLFTSGSDLRETWGLIQHYGNVVQPAPASAGALGFPVPTAQCDFTGAKVLYVARTGDPDVHAGPIEMFWVGGKKDEALGWGGGICRAVSEDEAATWSRPEVVINGSSNAGALPWMENAQNMGRRPDTGEYMSLIFGSKACAYQDLCERKATRDDRNPFFAHGALGFILRSRDGVKWTCDGGFVNGSCNPAHPTTIDHDDASMTFDSYHDHGWVTLQVVIEQGPKPRLPSGLQFHDNSGGRRVVGFRSSKDGRNWSCVASCGSSQSYEADPMCRGGSGALPFDPLCPNTPLAAPEAPVVRPNSADPPELQFYRARPWRYGDRWVAAVYNYAPSPLCDTAVMGCHGPHLGSEWWVQPRGARLTNHSAWERPYAWQRLWRTSRVFGPHRTLNHAPLFLRGQHLWLSSGGEGVTDDKHPKWYALPAFRLGGVYAPGTGQFCTETFSLPAAGLTLNVDAKWSGGLTHSTVNQCDTLHELCQSYVLYELLVDGQPVPGFTALEAQVIEGIDSTVAPLQWANSTTSAWRKLVGKEVALRFTFRDAIIYSLGAAAI